jgi:hypothetical protein
MSKQTPMGDKYYDEATHQWIDVPPPATAKLPEPKKQPAKEQ